MNITDYKRFPKYEYERRWKKAQKLMERENIDALLITEPLNYLYFSGASPTFSYARVNILILPRNGNPIIAIHEFVEETTRRETWIKDVRVYKDFIKGPLMSIAEIFKQLGLMEGRVGAELGYEQRIGLPFNDFLKLQKMFPRLTFVDASKLIWEVRVIKSNLEIERLREACNITSKAYEECFNEIHEGLSEKDVAKIFIEKIFKLGGRNPWCFINSGPYNYNVISGGPTNNRLSQGNILWIDGGCTYEEYWSDFSRIASIGEPSEKQRKMYEITLELTETCIDAIKPGIKASEIAKLCEEKAKEKNVEITFRAGRIGHGIGLMLTEPPHIALHDNTTLKPGMVITIEPGFVTDYGCFQAEQVVLVTATGAEILSKASTELKIIK